MKNLLEKMLEGKTVAIAGFGREGQSTYRLLRNYFPLKTISVLDNNPGISGNKLLDGDSEAQVITGSDCFGLMDNFDIIFKSPGIPSNTLPLHFRRAVITSQTDIFLQLYGRQVIGVTGTKGKSTTSSLIRQILAQAGRDALLAGNIGLPPFEILEKVSPDTTIVMEMSSHQLEFVSHSPHIGILLNIFQEHLDHYRSYKDYQMAKMNIARFMQTGDFFIYNADNKLLSELVRQSGPMNAACIPFSLANSAEKLSMPGGAVTLQMAEKRFRLYDSNPGQPLQGEHNHYNIMAAAAACFLAGLHEAEITSGIRTFSALAHRLELVGTYAGIVWYNDSIATIPEATIEAVKTLKTVDTLILGGFDRGIDYRVLYDFLPSSGISNLVFVGMAGSRMMQQYKATGRCLQQCFEADDYAQVVDIAARCTRAGMICLLSPAAASYDMFSNFEERGEVYKTKVRAL